MSWNITENKQIKFADMIMTKKSSWITDLCKIRLTDCIVFFSCSGKILFLNLTYCIENVIKQINGVTLGYNTRINLKSRNDKKRK